MYVQLNLRESVWYRFFFPYLFIFLLPVMASVWILQHVYRMEESFPAASSLDGASEREIEWFLYIHF